MKRFKLLFFLMLGVALSYANLLSDITDGVFKIPTPEVPTSMNDGEFYTLMGKNKAIVKYNYRTGATTDTIFSISRIKDAPFKTIEGYEFSPNELKILVYTNSKKRYRRSFTADYYIYDIKRNEILALSDRGSQEVPLFSPDSRYIAFGRENNLFLYKIDFNTESAVTTDGAKGSIINGIPDWVYEEEFVKTRYFEWSPDSKMLAFVKFNETQVPEFSFQRFLNTDTTTKELKLYPSIEKFKYPKAGENNSRVSVCVYDDFYKSIKNMQLPTNESNFYIPRIKWTNNNEQLAVFKLNRNQNKLEMFFCNPKSTLSKLIQKQEDKYYIDYEQIDYLHFLSDNENFISVNEKDGYRHIYQYRMNGTLVKQWTKGKWDVTDVYGFDTQKNLLFYQSAEILPMQRDIYMMDSKGKKTRLTDGKGTHNATFNTTYTYFIDNASSIETPNILTLRSTKGENLRLLEKNATVAQKFKSLNLPQKEFISFSTSENIQLNGWMIKPLELDTNKKYPVLLIQYSGPDSQQVLNKWSIDWEYYLATKDYIVVCVDGRGTGARGTEFRKCTYENLGLLESKDQIETTKYLSTLSYVDKNRIGIWGWSFGGTITLMAMTTGEKVFKAGIAVAPVTDWRLYNTAYTERFMKRPQEDFKGYDVSSVLSRAKNLQGNLLLIHGTADDNVHVQNTLLFTDELVKADKQFEMQLYTDKNHSILGKQTRKHLYIRMSEFLFRNL